MTNATTAAVPVQATPNKLSFADLQARAQTLGADAGKGRDTQVRMLLSLVEGGFQGAVTLDPNKHGADVDDCTKLAETYVKAQSGATMFDAKAPNQKKLISCFRTCVKLGGWPKGGMGEPLATTNNLIALRQKLRGQPATAKKLDDAANTLLRFARAQLRRDTLIQQDELEEFCMKRVRDHATEEETIVEHRDGLIKLRDGKLPGNIRDSSQPVKDAINSLTKRIIEIQSEKAAAKKAGLKVVKFGDDTDDEVQVPLPPSA